jgi:hypothetical protein
VISRSCRKTGAVPCAVRRSGRVAEGGALLRRYGDECLHRGFESLLLRSRSARRRSRPIRHRRAETTLSARQHLTASERKKGAHGGNMVSPVKRATRRRRGAKRRGRDLNPRRTFQHVRDFQSRSLDHSDTSPGDAQRIHSREKARRRAASYHPRPEGWQSGRMRRSRKPLSVVRRIEGSNPSPSATYPLCSAFEAEERAPW